MCCKEATGSAKSRHIGADICSSLRTQQVWTFDKCRCDAVIRNSGGRQRRGRQCDAVAAAQTGSIRFPGRLEAESRSMDTISDAGRPHGEPARGFGEGEANRDRAVPV